MQKIAKIVAGGLILLVASNIVKAQAQDSGVELNKAQPARGDGEWEIVFEPVETRYLRLSSIISADGGDRSMSAAETSLFSSDNAEALD